MTLTPLDPFADAEPGFNKVVAKRVYDAILGLGGDEEAQLYSAMLLGGALQYDLAAYGPEIAQAASAELSARQAQLKKRLARAAVAKARGGQDPRAEIAALETVAKAFGNDPFTRRVDGRFARHEERSNLESGRFVRDQTSIFYEDGQRPRKARHAARLGIPAPAVPEGQELSATDRARYQQAYAQISDMVAPYTRLPQGSALLHLTVIDGDSRRRTEVADVPARGKPLGVILSPGDKISSAAVSVHPAASPAGAAYDALAAVGAPGAGARLAGAFDGGALDPERLRLFGEDAAKQTDPNEAFAPASRLFRRLEAGSQLLDDTLGDTAPKKVQYALKLGQHVGRYGPEAQKVIGPTADRAAYRYRGTERAPDRPLLVALASIARNPNLATGADKREYLVHGQETDTGWKPSEALEYFRARLPSPQLNTLQRKSGAIPPSEGIVLDAKGKVASQAVGFGDDHYLPFNLRHLTKLKGGEYIRTRTWGGPTTEDIYTGLVSGARSVTVVSHNGAYTVEFDNALRGGRRFNDKAARMVGRYGHLLDAVQSGTITTGQLDPSRAAEIRAEAEANYDPEAEPDRYASEVQRLTASEKRRPRLSQAQRQQASLDFFTSIADKAATRDGAPLNAEHLISDFVNHQAQSDYTQYQAGRRRDERIRASFAGQFPDTPQLPPAKTLEDFRAQRVAQFSDPDALRSGEKLADAMGVRGLYDAHLAKAEQDNAEALKSLQLNGAGYDAALTALQEQFPYYIRRVQWHPWADAANGRDTGYVKPHHNRPAAALAGYFDPSINGQGKVSADSTRFQNRRVSGGVLRPYRPAAAQPGTVTAPGGTLRPVAPSAAAAARPGSGVPADVTQRLQEDAARGLVDELRLRADGAISGAVRDADGAPLPSLAGTPVRDNLQAIAGQMPTLHGLLKMSPFDLGEELRRDPAGMHARLEQALKENDKHRLLDLDPKTVRTFGNGGKQEPALEVNDIRNVVISPDAEFNLPGRIFDKDAEPSSGDVLRAYASDGLIGQAVRAGQLPAELSGADFNTKAAELHTAVRTTDERLFHWRRNGERASARPATPIPGHDLARKAETLIRAKQLRRRYDEAVRRETEVLPPAAGPAGEVLTQNSLYISPPAELADMAQEDLDRWGGAVRRALDAVQQPQPGNP